MQKVVFEPEIGIIKTSLSWAVRGGVIKDFPLPTSSRILCCSGWQFSEIIYIVSNIFSFDIDNVSIVVDIIIVLSPTCTWK